MWCRAAAAGFSCCCSPRVLRPDDDALTGSREPVTLREKALSWRRARNVSRTERKRCANMSRKCFFVMRGSGVRIPLAAPPLSSDFGSHPFRSAPRALPACRAVLIHRRVRGALQDPRRLTSRLPLALPPCPTVMPAPWLTPQHPPRSRLPSCPSPALTCVADRQGGIAEPPPGLVGSLGAPAKAGGLSRCTPCPGRASCGSGSGAARQPPTILLHDRSAARMPRPRARREPASRFKSDA